MAETLPTLPDDVATATWPGLTLPTQDASCSENDLETRCPESNRGGKFACFSEVVRQTGKDFAKYFGADMIWGKRFPRPPPNTGIHVVVMKVQTLPASPVRLAGRAVILTVALVLAVGSPVSSQENPQESGLSEHQRKLNVESFEVVWTTVRDKHYDPKLGGLDWQAVHDEFKPKIEKAANQKEVRALLDAMLDRLGQSHFGIIPNEVYQDVTGGNGKNNPSSKDDPQGKGVPGFDVRVLDGKAIVVRIDTDLPAAKLGVKPGWEVVQAGPDKIGPLIEKVGKALKEKSSKGADRELAVSVLRKLRGKQGDKLDVVFRAGDDKEVKLAIPLVRQKGSATKFGHLPVLYVDVESKKVGQNVAYFRLSTFADPLFVMPRLQKTVLDNLSADGFIIDLRGNPGGIGGMAMGVGNWFINKPSQKLGTMMSRDSTLNFVLNPRAQTYDGPLAILVDGLSGSTSEILAGGLKDLKRATIFGTKTMGAALPSIIERLPNKDGFQYAIANYISVGGKPLEGHGVVPDVEVPLTRKVLLAGSDPVLDAAVNWIQKQKKETN
jgi:carboxyl-terminal processing protease